MKNKILLKGGLFIGLISLVLVLGSASLNYFEINKQLDIFANLFREVNTYYVDDTEPGDLMEDAITNMLKNLDPYTVYIPENDIENYRIMQTGQYGGIGATIMKYGDYVVITAPRKGSPADEAGLQAGDIIKSVAGKDMKGKTTEDLGGMLKGSPGTEVEMTYERDGVENTITLKRADIQLKSVPFYGMLDSKTGYIVLTSFTNKASKDITEALKELKKNEGLESVVLDLRSNPGGLLSEAINVSNIFVPKGKEIVSTKGRSAETTRNYRSLKEPVDAEIPVVILINGNSASASEIVAGTLQDLDRAVVMGQQSYGKGLVQQTKPLSYGSQVKITIAKYYTPSGRCVQAINYAKRDEDGKVKRLPDSLRTEFKTAGGRTVLDGAGVDPDVNLDAKIYPLILMSLVRNHHVFDFVNNYKKNHPEIAPAGEFTLTDKEYGSFVKYLNDKEYHYKTQTEKLYKRLKEASEDEEYTEISGELKQLENAIEKAKRDDLQKFKPVIKAFLEVEITERYYYQEGKIKQKIYKDSEVKMAMELLANQDKYKSILTLVE